MRGVRNASFPLSSWHRLLRPLISCHPFSSVFLCFTLAPSFSLSAWASSSWKILVSNMPLCPGSQMEKAQCRATMWGSDFPQASENESPCFPAWSRERVWSQCLDHVVTLWSTVRWHVGNKWFLKGSGGWFQKMLFLITLPSSHFYLTVFTRALITNECPLGKHDPYPALMWEVWLQGQEIRLTQEDNIFPATLEYFCPRDGSLHFSLK